MPSGVTQGLPAAAPAALGLVSSRLIFDQLLEQSFPVARCSIHQVGKVSTQEGGSIGVGCARLERLRARKHLGGDTGVGHLILDLGQTEFR
jgi:hypothetical protein